MVLWEPDALEQAVERVVRRGWRVGTHAYGDRAVRILLDVYERVLASNPGLPPGTLVMEHAGLAGAGPGPRPGRRPRRAGHRPAPPACTTRPSRDRLLGTGPG